MNAAIDEDFSGMHEPHWVLRSAFQLLVLGLVFTEVMLALTVHRGLIWLAVPLVLVASHLMHGALIGLHEAAHGLLRKNRGFNEFDGLVIGTLSLMSFSLIASSIKRIMLISRRSETTNSGHSPKRPCHVG